MPDIPEFSAEGKRQALPAAQGMKPVLRAIPHTLAGEAGAHVAAGTLSSPQVPAAGGN